jgi:hypothetical protein
MRLLTWFPTILTSAALGMSACTSGSRLPTTHEDRERRDLAAEQEMVNQAWLEYTRRGGSHERAHTKLMISKEGRIIFVSFTLLPEHPGGYFEVSFDAVSGRLLNYLPGL